MNLQKEFITKSDAELYTLYLSTLVPWLTFEPSPNSRKVFRYGDYHSRADLIIKKLISLVQVRNGVKVNGVFLNKYKDGNDYCPYHKDMYNQDIYTLSLGVTRDFLIKPDGKGTKSTKYKLENGDLYFMPKEIHETHKHSVPKRKNCNGLRISVVFFVEH